MLKSTKQFDGQLQKFQEEIENDIQKREEIKTAVHELEQITRDMLTTLQKIHHSSEMTHLVDICREAKERVVDVKAVYATLSNLIPPGQYYKYIDHYRYTNQRVVTVCSLIYYLETETLLSREDCSAMIGVAAKREENTFILDLEDYLIGILNLASELARFAVNSVTSGDYNKPIQIAAFIKNLDAGFRLLNLKNDFLRKRFDGLKYDVKKTEEIVYDLSIRGLKSTDTTF